MQPKFQHEHCPKCKFYGHFYNCDVYICNYAGDVTDGSIIARFSDLQSDYASSPLESLIRSLTDPNHRIGGVGPDRVTMKYWDYIWSEHCSPYHKAWVRALSTTFFSEKFDISKEFLQERKLVKIEQLPLQKTEQREFVDLDEYLTAIRWTDWVSHLSDVWSITARYCGDGMVELVGDGDQIYTYLKENASE